MKVILLMIPGVLSFVLLAAHFLRAGQMVLVVICLGMPALLLIRRWWSLRLIQVALLVGALEWLRTLVMIIDAREAQGRPWMASMIILGAVIFFTIASAALLLLPSATRYFRRVLGSELAHEA